MTFSAVPQTLHLVACLFLVMAGSLIGLEFTSRLGWLSSDPRRSTCRCLPGTETTKCVPPHGGSFPWDAGDGTQALLLARQALS